VVPALAASAGTEPPVATITATCRRIIAEASELGKLIEAYIKALEATDFAERLDKLERMTNR
jgi:hypothetical protein